MDDPRQVILRPIISERSYDLINDNHYTFEVAKKANKIEIGQAVEAIFNVKVLNVNTMNVKGKPKRVRYAKGYTRSWKKAIVTIAKGDSIEAFGV
jgi:large subunit ribosomal protein L23